MIHRSSPSPVDHYREEIVKKLAIASNRTK